MVRTRILCPLLALTLPLSALAGMSHDDYLKALKIAEKKVERQNEARSRSMALSSSVLSTLFGRYYQVGDNWDIAAWRFDNPMMRMTAEPDHLQKHLVRGGTFHYEVVEVKTGSEPRVKIKVTQTQDRGMKPVDPQVESLTLTMTDQLIQSQKAYKFNGESRIVPVSAEGVHSGITALELYPLDVPEVVTADKQTRNKLPELPGPVADLAQQVGFSPNLSQSLWFEQDDFFGRPVQILWQHGDPWPVYFKTTNGIAILIHKDTR